MLNFASYPFALLQLADAPSLLEQLTVGKLLTAAVIMAAAWLAIRLVERLLGFLSARVSRARFFFKRAEPILRISLWFAAAFLVVTMLSPSRETFFAAVASIGLALGLGAQDIIKNVIGGLVVLGDRPYQLGDRVRIGDSYGEIDHIGLRSTKLTTPDDTRVTIPNADVLTQHVFNSNSGVPDCQVVTDLFLPISADADQAARIGREAGLTSPYLLTTKPVQVLVAESFDYWPRLRVRIKAYVYDHRHEAAMQSDITKRARREVARQGLGFDNSDQGRPAARRFLAP